MKRNKFSLSYYQLLTCDMGELVPIGITEVLPGDTVQQSTSMLVRVSPLVAPVMHPVHVRVHHWYVPFRLLWDKWEDFITGGIDGMDASAYPITRVSAAWPILKGSLHDYLGIPPGLPVGETYSMLPFRAYALIWNEWYRDQDLQAPVPISLASGEETTTSQVLQHVGWEKDYFTSARPWTQKGPEINLPLTGTAPLKFPTPPSQWVSGDRVHAYHLRSIAGNSNVQWNQAPTPNAAYDLYIPPDAYADLSAVNAVSINDLREAFALQRYEENRARFGSRFTEYLAFLGIRSSDARLQRPEYLGGGKQVIQFSEVLQTAPPGEDPDDTGVGSLKGHGIGAVRSNRYRRFFEEHGYVLTLMSVKPKTMYSDGLARHWSKRIKEEYWQRELEHIGQQEVFNRELKGNHTTPGGVFGYQDRYDEYRRAESGISGDFHDTLSHWHYARQFANSPVLNADFVKCTPTKRVNVEQTADCLWIMANHSIQARRLLSKQGTSFIM